MMVVSHTRVTAQIQSINHTHMDNKSILYGAVRVLLLLFLLAGNYFGFWYLCIALGMANSLFNLLGIVGLMVMLILDLLILKALLKTHTKK